jgi:asparagine synthase (glutamine-hydrolysing)
MCGICGLVSTNPIGEQANRVVMRMNRGLAHRGPNSEGEFSDSHVSLAMRRLSIIDLVGGSQPLYNEDRTLVLIANGEIYNFVELRSQLIAKGHRFSTGSDCETIVHLYEDYGTDCVNHLRGMFAFALWDSRRKRLMLARDRMGEKPLYLFEKEGELIFASELKALLQSGLVPFELDPEAINLYFLYQYVPEPMTPIKGVVKLDAAQVLTIDVAPWRVDKKQYWRMEDSPPIYGDPAEIIREELETVSELVIRSDVPVGVALSGGLDSSAITALAAKKYPGLMHSFCVGYPSGQAGDERRQAQAVAEYLKIPFHQIELETGHFVDFFPELVYWQDDPIADIAGYCYYAVMKLAQSKGIPVVLQGQGGDELFWGYPWVRDSAVLSEKRRTVNSSGLKALSRYWSLHALPRDLSRPSLGHWLRTWGGIKSGIRLLQLYGLSPGKRLFFYDLAPDFSLASRKMASLYSRDFLHQLRSETTAPSFNSNNDKTPTDITVTRLICDTYLRENGIAQADRLSMASSIELRLPLVDYRLVEKVVGLRKAHTDLELPAKAWFKEAVRDFLPKWVIDLPKRGFTPPVREWQNALFARHCHNLSDGYIVEAGVLTTQAAQYLTKESVFTGAAAAIRFRALVLELWCRGMSMLCNNSRDT